MSDYVRKKAVRYKIPEKIVEKVKNEFGEDFGSDSFEKYYNKENNVINTSTKRINNLNVGSGYNFTTDKHDYYIDYILYDEYGVSSGEFESVRALTQNEDKKYIEIFKKAVSDIKQNELRYVDYCYYNGVDEPTVWEQKRYKYLKRR